MGVDVQDTVLDRFDRVEDLRAAIRAGRFLGQTAGHAPGKLQANLAILPAAFAGDFEAYARANPRACPLVGMGAPGDPVLADLGAIDIRSDVPSYNIYRHGVLTETRGDISELWQDDFVTFALGCSFTFERALIEAGIPLAHVAANTTVPMYRTNIETTRVGPFGGGMVVSLRFIAPEHADAAAAISAEYPWAHGGPIHTGAPEEIGITDVMRPDWGDPPVATDGTAMFWPCGVTPQNALAAAKPPICITHTPGRMLVTDIDDTKNAFLKP
ncbi:MAG: putative hydro-lyase [Pseudomonadota bacterium]